ncbi:hypothetical protein [Peribacillus deserti]|uniref:Uncharacterized protein n=1 Tax=Peribacillus deserti TaxID=673318 RepID=A0A2N5M6D4_9BACI|nr:hypothetical protein [Peribacillus deserti]PLT29853.1 hypothetical protein CUU66_11170 [Peribacillus deserti]
MLLEEILDIRTGEQPQVYLIESEDGLYVIKGSYFSRANKTIQDIYNTSLNQGEAGVGWDFLAERINLAEENEDWTHVKEFGKVIDLKVTAIYADGDKIYPEKAQ